FKTSEYISLVNLLAGEELYPEYLTDRCEAAAIGEHILRWLNDPAAYDAVCARLTALRGRVAEPGACERAARYILEFLHDRQRQPGRKAAYSFPTPEGEAPMKPAIVIPARYASTRLPGKPLLRQTGKYLIQHVYERARRARRASQVIVATDDPRIV